MSIECAQSEVSNVAAFYEFAFELSLFNLFLGACEFWHAGCEIGNRRENRPGKKQRSRTHIQMADASTSQAKRTTDLLCVAVPLERLRSASKTRPNASFVVQLIANASGLADMPKRRESDRAGPLAAYANPRSQECRTRRTA